MNRDSTVFNMQKIGAIQMHETGDTSFSIFMVQFVKYDKIFVVLRFLTLVVP